ncbi:DUF1989 domain-containing protein [Acinetobacter sichuanensis]|uniref:urea amidolyase associated protein UAAP2 n=1 Tax=Acinetobacter sichuanensis TaxID=2136183 RepID=UPI00280D927F|nr:urea amidolyase associated protein UAAP2 [Acinetobacter sichuanensis]MDQ9019961.1 DUF1989 domain-containing protein [Acinetobacter sichuanensis]
MTTSATFKNTVIDEVCLAGEAWMCEVKQGQFFRIIDLEGNQAVDTLFISADDPNERYSATDTLAINQQIYLEKGTTLYSNFARPIATIHDDNCGRHDTLGGACSCESNTVRYSLDKYPMHSCRNNFMYALAKHPIALKHELNVRHIGPNINFFMNVPVTAEGALKFDDGISAPGKYVEILAAMDLIVLISNCPQLNNPCNAYNPTQIQLVVREAEGV